MKFSKLELQFRRLLLKLELFRKKDSGEDVKFQENLDLLDKLFVELKSVSNIENVNLMNEYSTRINALKNEDYAISQQVNVNDIRLRNSKQNDYEVLESMSDRQNEIVDNMSNLVKRLKQNAESARQVIRKDIQTMSNSLLATDLMGTKLLSESENLRDHSRRAFKLYVWCIIVLVAIVFVGMVFFMKVAKKKS